MFNRIPLAWLQLTHEKTRMLTAIAGVVFANVLMFMQLGFQDALFNSTTLVQRKLQADIVIINTNSDALFTMKSFSRRRLYQTLSHESVERVVPMYVGLPPWKNPWTGRSRSLLVMGFDPEESVLDLPGIAENRERLKQSDTVLFDTNSRPEFGNVAEVINQGGTVSTEVNRNRIDVVGLFTLGASFAADGNLITSDLNFLRIFAERRPEAIDVGIVKLKPGADPEQVKRDLAAQLSEDVRVLTHKEFVALEREYWETSTAIGFVFSLGVLMGFLVGLIISYQILHTDVVNHLSEYATLKAMGYTDRYLLKVVFQEALLLSVIGYIPGILISWLLFDLTEKATSLPMDITLDRLLLVLGLTIAMCAASGAIAVRKLSKADPAEIF
jgi:putative ABC transport system permease protein